MKILGGGRNGKVKSGWGLAQAGLLALLIGGLPGSAGAWADLKTGAALYKKGDYAGAIQEWRPLAEQNDPNALFNMGQVYRLGRGVNADLAMARKYYERAAVLGHVAAQNYLGTLLYFAEPPLKDTTLALKWWKIAAENGDAGAQYMLGVLYFNGDAVKTDWPRAYAWMLLAARAGLPEAQNAEKEMLRHLNDAQKAEGRALAPGLLNQGGHKKSMIGQMDGAPTAPLPPADAPDTADMGDQASMTGPEEAQMAADAADAAETPGRDAPSVASAMLRKPAAGTDAPAAAPEPNPDTKPAEATPISPSSSAPEQETPAATVPAESQNIAPAEAAPAETVTASVRQAWHVQLAALRSEADAQATWRNLAKANKDIIAALRPEVEKTDLGERGVFYRLYAGPLSDKAAAADLCAALSARKQGCMVKPPQ